MMVGMSTGETWTLGHRPALDGLRGIAILLVVACHAVFGAAYITAGTLGVTVFFTLSGFLITALLLGEHERDGRVSLSGFYRRRALRLMPALLVMLAIVGAFQLAVGMDSRALAPILLYVGNWPAAADAPMGLLLHTWSLAVEEQFYLVWPLLVVVVLRVASRRALLAVAGAGVVASTVSRWALWDGGSGAERVYFGSDTRVDALLVGCALAAVMHGRVVRRANTPAVATVVVAAFALLGAVPEGHFYYVAAPTVAMLGTVAAIWAVTQVGCGGWLESRPLVLIGQRSYGLYLWHSPIAVLLLVHIQPRTTVPRVALVALVLLLSAAATWLSWRYVEQPFLRRRHAVRRNHLKSATGDVAAFSLFAPISTRPGVNGSVAESSG